MKKQLYAFLILIFLSGHFFIHGQVRVFNSKKDSSFVNGYLSHLSSSQPDYFYLLYSNNHIKVLEYQDTLILKRFLSRPNEFSDEFSHFFTANNQLKGLNNRKDSLLLYGYLPDETIIRQSYTEMRQWQELIHVKYDLPKVALTNNYYRPTINSKVPYYLLPNRYDFLSKIKENERSQR